MTGKFFCALDRSNLKLYTCRDNFFKENFFEMLKFRDGKFRIMQIADVQEDYPVNPDKISKTLRSSAPLQTQIFTDLIIAKQGETS